MSERCEMCGAKLRPDDEACRECGEATMAPVAEPDTSADITAVEPRRPGTTLPITSPSDTDPELTLEIPRRRVAPYVGFALVVALGGAGAYAWTSSERGAAPPPATLEQPPAPVPVDPAGTPTAAAPDRSCAEFEALAGRWTFTTEVAGARVVQSSGLNGYYTLEVAVEDCTASATITKTGYTARTYGTKRIQHGGAQLQLDRFGFATASLDLASALGPHGAMELSFIGEGDTLSGVYRQRGERWNDAGLFGFLHGARGDEAPRQLVASTEPCLTRCHLACGSAVREDVTTEALRACEETCVSDPSAAARCGDATVVPSAYALPLAGPQRLSKLCASVGGCTNDLGRRGKKSPSLFSEDFPPGWTEAKLIQAKKEGGVRLALHGARGWWLSGPVFDAPRGARLGTMRLYARQLSETDHRRYVLGLVRTGSDDREAYVACRLDDSPSCVRVLRSRASFVNALPEGNLSVADGAAEPAGVFHW